MAWVHDSGYEPAYAPVGYPVAIQIDGTETASSTVRTPLEVIGWRSAGDCGWRGMQFYSRREWPSTSALAPDGVDGWDTGTAGFGEWERLPNWVLPELAVHDLARQRAEVEERLARACRTARFAGVSWARLMAITRGTATIESARHREVADSSSTTAAERQLRHGRRHRVMDERHGQPLATTDMRRRPADQSAIPPDCAPNLRQTLSEHLQRLGRLDAEPQHQRLFW